MEQYGIYQVTIPLPFRLNHVHCYLAKEGREWTIIDTGLQNEETRKAWAKAFDYYRIDPKKDIRRIILTHHHSDHIGFAGELQDWTQATVWMSDAARDLAFNFYTEPGVVRRGRFYSENGVPKENIGIIEKYDRKFLDQVGTLKPQLARIQEGDLIRIGDLDYEAIHTPGHAYGHLSFYNRQEQVILAGDHLLSKITPNISCNAFSEENPLENYMQSLKKIHHLPISRVLPGHGPMFGDASRRIHQLIEHHENRLSFTLEGIKGEMTAYEVSKHLFNRELSVHEKRSAIGETIAHLNYLVNRKELKKELEPSGIWLYGK